MLQNKFTKLFTILTVSTGLSVVVPAIMQSVGLISTIANAATLAPDGPWKTSSRGLTELQRLNNGNEIYYSIAPNDEYTNLFQNAVNDWNSLGVIKLVQVNWSDEQSQITMQSNVNPKDDDDDTEDGSTNNGALNDINGTAVISQSTIKLYSSLSDLPSKNQQVVADHELGHALGFDHDNRKIKSNGKKYRNYRLTMNEYDSYSKYYKLGGIEQHMLEDHYNLTASVDLSNMNC